MSSEIGLVLEILDQAFDKKSWHGTNLRGSLRGVEAELALWRPGTGRHSIWELVLHTAYWKYVVRRRLTGEKRGSFPLAGSDWFEPQGRDAAAWREAVALLVESHRSLREAVAEVTPGQLSRPAPGGKDRRVDLIAGVAAHDLHHAGQIQLIKKLAAGRR